MDVAFTILTHCAHLVEESFTSLFSCLSKKLSHNLQSLNHHLLSNEMYIEIIWATPVSSLALLTVYVEILKPHLKMDH